MKQAYDAIMEHIQLTDERKRRILDRLPAALEHSARPSSRWKGWAAAAACFVLLLVGVSLFFPAAPSHPLPSQPVTNPVPEIKTLSSLAELSQAVGFPVEALPHLPFTPTEESYTAYWSELAQVTYSDGTQTAVFRKSAGTEDNSGDYTVYETALQLELEGYTVTLKGDAGGYVLAVWSKDGYAYSLKLSAPYPQEEWETILNTL